MNFSETLSQEEITITLNLIKALIEELNSLLERFGQEVCRTHQIREQIKSEYDFLINGYQA